MDDLAAGQGWRSLSVNSAAETPSIRMTFSRDRSPLTMCTDERGTPSDDAKYATTARFAASSTAGAAMRSLSELPCIPANSVLLARGWT